MRWSGGVRGFCKCGAEWSYPLQKYHSLPRNVLDADCMVRMTDGRHTTITNCFFIYRSQDNTTMRKNLKKCSKGNRGYELSLSQELKTYTRPQIYLLRLYLKSFADRIMIILIKGIITKFSHFQILFLPRHHTRFRLSKKTPHISTQKDMTSSYINRHHKIVESIY